MPGDDWLQTERTIVAIKTESTGGNNSAAGEKLITKNIPGGVHGKFIVIEPEKLSFFSALASRSNSHLLRKKFSHKFLRLRMSEANWVKPGG